MEESSKTDTNLIMEKIIEQAFLEDMPGGDITTDGLGVIEKLGVCLLVAKQDLVMSGSDFFTMAVQKLNPTSKLNWRFNNGDKISNGSEVCEINGNLIEILKAERVALNLLGHLSGIATSTNEFVNAAAKITILDTRKTLPLYREFEKKAVCHGGGSNHRMNLSDAILIKENHICAAGSLKKAVLSIKNKYPDFAIEIEVKTLEEVKQAVEFGAHRLLLDNMTNQQLAECLDVIPKSVKTEASGNMTVERVRSLNDLPLDFISVGAITHSAPTADFSLLFQWG